MKVGLVCPYSLDVPGGVQNHVRDLAEVLRARGHEVGVLAPGERPEALPAYVTLAGKAVAVPYNGSVARLAFGPRVSARTTRWLREGDFDLVHIHEPLAPSVSVLALWACEVPIVATFHTANVRSRTLAAVASVVRPSTEKIAARIAVSDAARATLVQHLGGEPVVIPNGLFCDVFASAEPEPTWQRPGPVVGFLGRTDEPRKGLTTLLAAWDRIRTAVPGSRLLVAGRGEPPIGLPDGVAFLGPVDDPTRQRLLRSIDLYVAPQTSGESFGIVLAEAMAAGAAVAASDLPAFRAVLDDGRAGRLFRTGDAADLSDQVVRLLRHPDERAAVAEAGTAAVRRFDWSRVGTEIVAVYETVVRGAAR
jgi:phosphatidyl-myo-inositol alpha-mannosyltransferase